MKISFLVVIMSTLFLISCSHSADYNSQKFSEGEAKPASFWWPKRLDLTPLRQHANESNPYGDRFNYAKQFRKVNIKTLKKDIEKVLTDSQEWWPADWGNYGPFFIRMAWHSAGTYRVADGRGGAGGGQQRFEPLNSWPDNANLDKARRLLWPIKKKYGRKVSWADLMILAGNVAMESMGFKTLGFAGGRIDDWEADLVYWGPETKMLDDKRHHGDRKLDQPLAAVQMGLIYVNPEGPGGNHDPLSAAKDIRVNFGRMAMNDEETVALIAGGHTFGKGHGANRADKCVGPEPAAGAIEDQGFGWKNKCGKGKAEDTITSGLEGAWSASPTEWTMQYLDNLWNYEWEKRELSSGGTVWMPTNVEETTFVPDAHIKGKNHQPIMYTTDMALKMDPIYAKISKRFKNNPKEFEDAFARAWFKLTHRDMGPKARYVGSDTPKVTLKWQDPVPAWSFKRINKSQAADLKQRILKSGLSISQLVRTAWAAAASYRGTDMRGGTNGGRLLLAPQMSWEVNNPEELKSVMATLKSIRKDFNNSLPSDVRVSMADTIVLAGNAAVEAAAKKAGYPTTVPFTPWRSDASQKQTDVKSFSYLEPKADPFRNYYKEHYLSPTQALVDRANLLGLTVPEMTVLVGGMRALGANYNGSKVGIFTSRPGRLTNDWFVNLLSMSTKWSKSDQPGIYEGRDRKSGKLKYKATPVDLIFGSHSELRAVAEVYAANDGKRKLVRDFVKAWTKVMRNGRF